MNRPLGFRLLPWLSVLGMVAAVGCGAAPSGTESAAPDRYATTAEVASGAEAGDATAQLAEVNTVPQAPPQLVKRAQVTVQVEDADGAITSVNTLLRQQQGELLNLSDNGAGTDEPRRVTLEMRVPSTDLTATLTALKQLGTVQQQTLTAEDVSGQLVDLDARLKNLRQSEAALQEIMTRTGSIAEVLEVSRELSTVRETIERTAAQQQHLQSQVAYSTITLTLQTAIAPVPNRTPLGDTLGRTWQSATYSMGTLSIALLRLGLWLLAYSPYWAILLLIGLGYRRWQHQHRPQPPVS
jgi:hypothetical protein